LDVQVECSLANVYYILGIKPKLREGVDGTKVGNWKLVKKELGIW
jgi:hypothetical protein